MVAVDRLNPPDLRVEVMSNFGDAIVVRLIEGKRTDPDALLYVERRGLYEVMRDEKSGERPMLTLRAWPSR